MAWGGAVTEPMTQWRGLPAASYAHLRCKGWPCSAWGCLRWGIALHRGANASEHCRSRIPGAIAEGAVGHMLADAYRPATCRAVAMATTPRYGISLSMWGPVSGELGSPERAIRDIALTDDLLTDTKMNGADMGLSSSVARIPCGSPGHTSNRRLHPRRSDRLPARLCNSS